MEDGLLARLRRFGRAKPAADAPPPVALEDVRRRLELLLAALYGLPIAIAPAEAPRAPGRLSRLVRRIPPHLVPTAPLPASDGERVLLPAQLVGDGGDAISRYRLLAMQQAERLARGTAAALEGDEPPLVRDLFLLAEAAAVEDAIARTAPGLAGAQAAERAQALAQRPALDALTPAEREVERLVRDVLATDAARAAEGVPASPDPAQSLAWARATAARLAAAGSRYRGVPPVGAWGAVLPASEAARARAQQQQPRTDAMQAERQFWGSDAKNKRAGSAGGTSTDPSAKAMLENVDSATDDSPEALVAGGSGPTSDIPTESPMAQTGGSDSPAVETRAPGEASGGPPPVAYPEWDCEANRYHRPGAWVRVAGTPSGYADWAAGVLQVHGATVRRLRAEFERLRARRQRLTAQRDGEELDLAACVRALVDLRTGHAVSDRLYAAVRPARRELAILLLVDISGSTTEHVNGVRIIDVEREALLLASEAFDALGDRYAVLTFSGRNADNVRMRLVKHFSERNGDEVRGRVAMLRPEGYTRMGAAIRHASALLAREGARHRLLLILSDGKPNDEDRYQGRYAVEDTRQAVAEARALGIFPFCVTVDQKGSAYLPRIFGPAGHMILHHPEHLPLALLKVVRGLLRG